MPKVIALVTALADHSGDLNGANVTVSYTLDDSSHAATGLAFDITDTSNAPNMQRAIKEGIATALRNATIIDIPESELEISILLVGSIAG